MKFCAVICEYNPFHNGHAYQFGRIREAGYEHILCIMSGNFTQRGEAAVFDKYTRAVHAVKNGADAVLELPAAFAVSPAELFAQGAVHILSSLPNVEALAFGCESGDKEAFLRAARAVSGEDKEFKALLKENMKNGTSYIRARNAAVLALNTDVDEALLSSPNNILGTEYCRALLSERSPIVPLPIPRTGSGYADNALAPNFSSAGALRAALADGSKKTMRLVKKNVPQDVFASVSAFLPVPYKTAAMCALFSAEAEKLADAPDCAEGLENRLKNLARSNPDFDGLLKKTVSKRYTLSRLKRILMQNFLGITLKQVRAFAESPLYCRVLAVKKGSGDEILSSLAGGFPVIVRKSDSLTLKKDARDCFALDLHADELYDALTGKFSNEFRTVFVE